MKERMERIKVAPLAAWPRVIGPLPPTSLPCPRPHSRPLSSLLSIPRSTLLTTTWPPPRPLATACATVSATKTPLTSVGARPTTGPSPKPPPTPTHSTDPPSSNTPIHVSAHDALPPLVVFRTDAPPPLPLPDPTTATRPRDDAENCAATPPPPDPDSAPDPLASSLCAEPRGREERSPGTPASR